MSEIKPEVLEAAKQFKGKVKISVDPNDSTLGLAVIEDPIYTEMLPEGLDVETIKKHQQHDSFFTSVSTLGFGEAGVDFFKKHKGVDKITLQVPTVGKDTFDYTLRRSVDYPNQKPTAENPGDKITKHAAVTVSHNTYSTNSVGELKRVKNHLAELGAKALAGK